MRRIGFIDDFSLATRFIDYLTTLDISPSLQACDTTEPSGRQEVWVKEEPKVEAAKLELVEFLKSPQSQKYSVANEATKRRQAKEADNRRRIENVKKVRGGALGGIGRANRPLVTIIMGAICLAAGLMTNFGRPQPAFDADGRPAVSSEMRVYDTLRFRSQADGRNSVDPFASIREGEVWRLITPTFLHGSIGHFAMNMLGLFVLGGILERVQGRGVVAVLLVVSALIASVVQALWPESNNGGPNAVGASGAIYGLFGYILIRPLYDTSFPVELPPSAMLMGLGFLLLGVAMIMPQIANGSHVGGLAAGMVLATMTWKPKRRVSGKGNPT